jgi:hypothetical protein
MIALLTIQKYAWRSFSSSAAGCALGSVAP